MIKRLAVVFLAATAPASWADEPAVSLQLDAGLATDLRDRGQSLADQDFTPFANIVAEHKSGFYLGGFAAGNLNTPRGHDAETEVFAGYAFNHAGYIFDLSAELDMFHGAGSSSYAEFKASVSRDFGLAFVRTSLSYAPDGRWSHPFGESLYGKLDLEIPVPRFTDATIVSRFGYDVRSQRADIADWAVGISYFIGDVELSLMYEDSAQDGELGEAGFVAGMRFFF